jgi:hypothetical protein
VLKYAENPIQNSAGKIKPKHFSSAPYYNEILSLSTSITFYKIRIQPEYFGFKSCLLNPL